MNLILGSAVLIKSEIDADQITGTVITLQELLDPDGNDWANGETLTFGIGDDSNIASVIWQSSVTLHPSGKYMFLLKTINGSRENFAKGSFYLEAQDA